jgi:hypothetical protein
LRSDSSKARRDLGNILQMVLCPPDYFIYVLNGTPVITGWGLTEQGPEPQIERTSIDSTKGIDEQGGGVTQEGGDGGSGGGSTGGGSSDGGEPVQRPRRLWPWSLLLALLLLFLGFLVYWFWFSRQPHELACVFDETTGIAVRMVKDGPDWNNSAVKWNEQRKTYTCKGCSHGQTVRCEAAPAPTVSQPSSPEPSQPAAPLAERVCVLDETTGTSVWIQRGGPKWSTDIVWNEERRSFVCKGCSQGATEVCEKPKASGPAEGEAMIAPPHKPGDRVQVFDSDTGGTIWAIYGCSNWRERYVWDPDRHVYVCKGCTRAPGQTDTSIDESPLNIVVSPIGPVSYYELKVTPADERTKWGISVASDAPDEVKRNPQKFITFVEPDTGLEAVGAKVKLAMKPLKDHRGFRVVVRATNSAGKQTAYTIKVEGAGR